jgi:hypothetical protein
MADKTITISISPMGALTYASGGVPADQFHTPPGNRLRWKCNDGDYAVFFQGDRSPFTPKKTTAGAVKGKPTTFGKIRKLKKGTKPPEDPDFKYHVSVLNTATGMLVTDDPDVIIDDPGDPGENKKKKKTAKKK